MVLLPLLLLSLLFAVFPDLSHALPSAVAGADYLIKLPLLHQDPLPSPSQALSSDARRLAALHHRSKTGPHLPVTSGASTGSGQYFVDLHVGNPPQRLLLVADTGSDLVWVACSACRNCSSHPPGSAFLARHSASFSPHHCFDSACRLVPHPSRVPCNRTRLHSPCRYEYSYSDGSKTSGFFSTETASFNTSSGSEVQHQGLAFGCGFRISGPSVTGPTFNGANGVMGLGRGPISLSSQLGRRFGNKFSYCLMDYTISPPPTSFLLIGGDHNGVVSGKPGLNYTPLQSNPLSPTFYYIGIQSVSVGGAKLRINPSVWAIDDAGNGGTIVDSGTTLTFLPDLAYRKIVAAFNRRVTLPSPAEPTLGFDFCLNVSGVRRPSLPRLSLKLVGGSVFSPPPRNYFVDTADGVKCLAVQPVALAGGFSVIGNLMQQGFLLEFDKDRSRLGFSRRGCALP
ncbi:aspartyl protease family protein 2 [Diospyros lotus]|uniref:aspartyl protease family protein 2 n=1 Tax=Diospyros lotus TaxID=55363 RepID=UPI002253CF0C|nr:aspartyl protease family protein 2 [Diospyros lotus]